MINEEGEMSDDDSFGQMDISENGLLSCIAESLDYVFCI